MSRDLYIFWIFLKGIIVPSFHHCRICLTDFREGSLFGFSIRVQPRKGPSWIELKTKFDILQQIIDETIEKVEEKEDLDSIDRVKRYIFQRNFEFLKEEIENSSLSGDKKNSLKRSQNYYPWSRAKN